MEKYVLDGIKMGELEKVKEIDVKTAERLIKTGEVFRRGLYYCKAVSIETDDLGRKWLKVKTWLIDPETANKLNICNAEGIGWIPLF